MSSARPSVREPRERLEGRPRRSARSLPAPQARPFDAEQLLRLDVAIGVLAAIVLLRPLAGTGGHGFVAFVLLLVVFGSIALERRRVRAQARERERRERLAARRGQLVGGGPPHPLRGEGQRGAPHA